MLLNEAGLSAVPTDAAPPEARDVVKFCNNLPLAVGMVSIKETDVIASTVQLRACSSGQHRVRSTDWLDNAAAFLGFLQSWHCL